MITATTPPPARRPHYLVGSACTFEGKPRQIRQVGWTPAGILMVNFTGRDSGFVEFRKVAHTMGGN